MKTTNILWFLLAAFALPLLLGADYAREQRWEEQVAPDIIDGEVIHLEARDRKFFSILTEADKPKGGVIVVHGLGVHPNWTLIGDLRTGLAERGYTTLSIQMPVLAADAQGDDYPPTFPEAAARIAAAQAYLKKKGFKKIALVAHSMGARMSHYYLTNAPNGKIDAWVAIGAPMAFDEAGKLKVPTLDLYGERDLDQVIMNADARGAVLKGIKGSRQIEAAGADHFFNGMTGELNDHVSRYLDATL